jgi:hypothetical protein
MESNITSFGPDDPDYFRLCGFQLVDFTGIDLCHKVIDDSRESHKCITFAYDYQDKWEGCECPYHSNRCRSDAQFVADRPLHPLPYTTNPALAVLSLNYLKFERQYNANTRLEIWQELCLRILRNRYLYKLLYGLLNRCACVNSGEEISDDEKLAVELRKESAALFVYYLGLKSLLK